VGQFRLNICSITSTLLHARQDVPVVRPVALMRRMTIACSAFFVDTPARIVDIPVALKSSED
jgi:hypothetical protein